MRRLALGVALAAVAAALAIALTPPGPGGERVVVTGSGSSFIAPQMYAWAEQLRERYPWLVVEYESVGSGAGVSNFLQGLRDFAASDPPLPRELWERYRGRVLQLPVIMGAVVVVYNVPGLNATLNLTGEVLAKIYKGEIVYWDDEEIARLNPGVELPHEEIVAVHRSDASGTTYMFTLFLHKSAPHVWGRELVGKVVDWPVDETGRGVGAKGNEGVVRTVLSTPYSIGYVEWSYALDAGLPVAAVANAAGEFVLPSRETIQAAAAAVGLPASPLDDFSGVPEALVYPEASGAYPIVSFTFLILWTEYPEEKAEAIRRLLEYVCTEGQEPGNVVEGYVPVPEAARRLCLEAARLVRPSGGGGG